LEVKDDEAIKIVEEIMYILRNKRLRAELIQLYYDILTGDYKD